jgi:hypothetical protein
LGVCGTSGSIAGILDRYIADGGIGGTKWNTLLENYASNADITFHGQGDDIPHNVVQPSWPYDILLDIREVLQWMGKYSATIAAPTAINHYRNPAPHEKVANLSDIIIREEGSGVLNWMLAGLDKIRASEGSWQRHLAS